MKQLVPLIALAVSCLPTTSFAQDRAASERQAALVAKRAKKLEAAFLSQNSWTTDFDKARAAAKKNEKIIFAYFSRSYSP